MFFRRIFIGYENNNTITNPEMLGVQYGGRNARNNHFSHIIVT
jgi:hypothetical protein